MRDSHEKGAAMQDQDPPFQTFILYSKIRQLPMRIFSVFLLHEPGTQRIYWCVSVSTHKHEPIMQRISNLNYDDDNL